MGKFRVWNKTDKKWMDDYAFALVDDGEELWQWIGLCDSTWELVDEFEYEIVFYTGLKDIRGKEIWEGDKLKYSIEGCKQSSPYVVNNPIDWLQVMYDPDPYYRWDNEGEVIGNVYEKPDIVV